MPSPRNRRHILITDPPRAEAFTTRRSSRPKAFQRPADRAAHARQLTVALTRAIQQGMAGRSQVVQAQQGQPGCLVAFRAPRGVELNLRSLENKHAGVELRGVARSGGLDDKEFIETATVFIPHGLPESGAHFLDKFGQYATQQTQKGHPKNRDLVD